MADRSDMLPGTLDKVVLRRLGADISGFDKLSLAIARVPGRAEPA